MASKKEKKKKTKGNEYSSSKDRADKHQSGFEPTAIRIPEGTKRFQIKKAGVYRFDIAPYRVGQGNPYASEGTLYFERTYYVHKGLGEDGKGVYVCANKTFGKPCAVCKGLAKMRRDPDVDAKTVKDMDFKDRQLFLIRDKAAPEDGWQVFDYSFFGFGKQLDAKVRDADEDDDYESFFHLEGGKTLKVSFEEQSIGTGKFYKATNIEMKDREDLEEGLPDELPCLDEMIIDPDQKKLEKIFNQGTDDGDDDEEEEDKKKKKAKSKKDDDDDDDDDEEEDDDTDSDDDDEDDDDEDDKKSKKKSKKKDEDEDKEEDDDDEDDDEEDESKFGIGDIVKFKYKGKKYKGEIKTINSDKELYFIHVEGQEKPSVVGFDDETLKLVEKGNGKFSGDEEDEDEDEDDKPKKKDKKSEKKSKSKDEDEDEDDDDEEEDEDEDEEDSDDEDEDEEEKPKKKSKKSKKDDDDEDDDDDPWEGDDEDDDEDDDEPKKKKSKK